MALILQFGAPAGSDNLRWVSGNGNDALDGLTQITAKREISAAYADLGSNGGTIYAMPGRYANFVISRAKPLELVGVVKPTKQIGSTQTTPLTGLAANAAVIYNSGSAVKLIDTIGGTAGNTLSGCRFVNLVFEMTGTVLYGIHAIQHCFGEVYNCVFFADKTTSPCASPTAAVWIHNDSTSAYGGNDGSWWRVRDNYMVNTAICQLGNPPAVGSTNSNNQHVVTGNVGLGLSRTDTTCLAAIGVWGGHRCAIRDNNIEGYHVGVLMDHCYGCTESGDGGEVVDVFVDLYSTHGCYFQPVGIQYATVGSSTPTVAGALLVRGDSFTKRNVFDVAVTAPTADTNGVYKPVDDATNPAFNINGAGLVGDNIISTPRYAYDFMRTGGTSTQTPGAVATVNIAHGLGSTPVKFSAVAANANARDATPKFHVTADGTNVILNYSGNLTGATSYAWQWSAEAR